MSATSELIVFVKTRCEQLGLTRQELAERASVGIQFVPYLEQGKDSL